MIIMTFLMILLLLKRVYPDDGFTFAAGLGALFELLIELVILADVLDKLL